MPKSLTFCRLFSHMLHGINPKRLQNTNQCGYKGYVTLQIHTKTITKSGGRAKSLIFKLFVRNPARANLKPDQTVLGFIILFFIYTL